MERLEETDAVGRIEGESRNLYLCDISKDKHVQDLYLRDRPVEIDSLVIVVTSVLFLIACTLLAIW